MSDTANLHIDTHTDSENKQLLFSLSGDVDVTAGSVLDALPAIPDAHKIILDFEAVERVNSMGLAQLMRHLEQWKTDDIKIEAINLNRMVSMLFKMTGLNRYFGENTPQQQSTTTHATDDGKSKRSRSRSAQFRRVKRQGEVENETTRERPPTIPAAPATPPPPQLTAEDIADRKMTFSVNLQSNQQLSGWYFLNTLLQRRLGRPMSMDIKQLGQAAELHNHALVFAKPFDACALMNRHHYIPVVRPIDDNVEVSIVVRSEDNEKNITGFAGATVATSTEASFVFLLGRFLCDESGLDSAKFNYQFTGNQLTAIRRLLDKEVDMLFMQKDNYRLLSELSRHGTHPLDESETGMAYHMLLISPAFAALQEQVTDEFLALQNDPQGKQALTDLGISAWCRPEPDEIAMLQMLYGRYVE